jgi:hypothetical protein
MSAFVRFCDATSGQNRSMDLLQVWLTCSGGMR